MLRTWATFQEKKMILEIQSQFDVEITDFNLQKFEVLTPDSFIWYFSSNKKNYCLYAEDYVPSIQHVEQAIAKNVPAWSPEEKFELIKVKNTVVWDESSPVTNATVYKTPENASEFMEFAYPSGHDFVFLAKSIM